MTPFVRLRAAARSFFLSTCAGLLGFFPYEQFLVSMTVDTPLLPVDILLE
jgi:hypothetical protein